MKTDTTSRFFLDFKSILISFLIVSSFGFGKGILDNYSWKYHTNHAFASTIPDTSDTVFVNYHGKALLLSLVLPGAGQVYNHEPWWKSSLFFGIEIAGLYEYWSLNKQAEDMRKRYEQFADDHWTLENFYYNTPRLFGEFGYKDVKFDGAHSLSFSLAGNTYLQKDIGQLNADSLQYLSVYRDRDFYENVGKYDEFVGGWDDVFDENQLPIFYEKNKTVGDSVEVLVMTNHRDSYLTQREKSNHLLDMGTFTVSVIMMNHLISVVDALWASSHQSKYTARFKPALGLLYDRKAQYGIRGVSLAVTW